MIDTWFGADTYLHGGRNKSSRPIENNTRIERRGDDIAVRLHGTDVVTFHKDNSVTLDSGGWLTVTTKDRMNTYLGSRAHVYSKRGLWHVAGMGDWTGGVRYFDGIRIAFDGTVLNPPDEALVKRKREAEIKMRKRIDRFVDGYMKALTDGMPLPGGGDCWDCLMLGDRDDHHLQSHLTESYYVPTMLWNAMKMRGYRDVAVTMGIFLDTKAWDEGVMRVRRAWHSAEPDMNSLKIFRAALGKYLRKRLIRTVAA
jgi:hypothetical protein